MFVLSPSKASADLDQDESSAYDHQVAADGPTWRQVLLSNRLPSIDSVMAQSGRDSLEQFLQENYQAKADQRMICSLRSTWHHTC
jgi:hypothetical protein